MGTTAVRSKRKELSRKYPVGARKALRKVFEGAKTDEESYASRTDHQRFGLRGSRRGALSVFQEKYAQNLTYSGVNQSTKAWAASFGLSSATLNNWHGLPEFQNRLIELQLERRQMLSLTLGGRVANAVDQLDSLLNLDPGITITKTRKDGELEKTCMLSPELVEQKRLALQQFFELSGMAPSANDKQTAISFNQVLNAVSAGAVTNGQPQVVSVDAIEEELRELRALEPKEKLVGVLKTSN